MPASIPLRVVNAPAWSTWAQEGRTFASTVKATEALSELLARSVAQQTVSASAASGRDYCGFVFEKVCCPPKVNSGRQLSWRGKASVVIQDPAERAAAIEELQEILSGVEAPSERDAVAHAFLEKFRTNGHLPPRVQWQGGKFAIIVQLLGSPRTRITLDPALADLQLARECSVAVQNALEGVDLAAPPPDLQKMLKKTVHPFQQRDDGVWSNLVEGKQHVDVHVAEGCVPGDGPQCGECAANSGDFTELVAYGLATSLLQESGTVTRSRARKCTEESCKRGARDRGREDSQCDHLAKDEQREYRTWLLEHMRSHPDTLYIFNGRWVARCFSAADLKVLESINFVVVPHLSLANRKRNREAIKKYIQTARGSTDLFEAGLRIAPSKRRAPIFKGTDAGGAFLLQTTSNALGPEHREKVYVDTPASSATLHTNFREKRRRLDGSSQQESDTPPDYATILQEAAAPESRAGSQGLPDEQLQSEQQAGPKPKRKQYPRVCEESACSRQPTFGTTPGCPLRCRRHRLKGMIDVLTRRCEAPDCVRSEGDLRKPIYAFVGETRGRFCAAHKGAGMVNVACCICAAEGCGKQVRTRGAFCKAH